MGIFQRRQITLLFLLILGITIWVTQRWWVPSLLHALGWFGNTPGDRLQALDAAINLFVLVFNAVVAYSLWLTRICHQTREATTPAQPNHLASDPQPPTTRRRDRPG
ncbi:MAG: hypothetical protein R2867_43355 [Caldilineaceae bacterium]